MTEVTHAAYIRAASTQLNFSAPVGGPNPVYFSSLRVEVRNLGQIDQMLKTTSISCKTLE